MSCDSCEEINPCSACNDCDAEVVPCTTPPYVQTGCPTLSSFKCSEYTGVGNECLGILTGDNGDEVIDKIADAVCDFISGDKYAKISGTDTTTGYLSDKVKAKVSSALTRTIKNPGGVEYIEFDIDVPSILSQVPTPQDKFTKVSSTDTTSNYLFSKVEQGSYILVTKANGGGDEKLHIAVDYNGLVSALNIIPDSFKFKISNTDTTEDFFSSKVITDSGSGILLNAITPSGNAKIKFALDYTAIHNQLGLDNINIPLSLSSPSSTININQSGASNHNATLDAKISAQAGNQLVNNNGLYVPTPASFTETTLVANDSSTIDFSQGGTNGHTITAAAKVSPTLGNILSILSNGLYVPKLEASDSSTIDFSQGSPNTLTASVKIKTGSNAITDSVGLYVNPGQFIQNQESVDQLANFRLRWGGGGARMYWNGSSLILLSDDPSNVFVGYDAFSGSAGNNNLGYGTACHVNGSGNFNTAIGTKAGWQHIGNRSIFVGYGAGYSTNGDNNTVVGVSGGISTTTANSTLIGAATSAGDLLATSGSINNSHVVVEGGPGVGTFTSTKLNGLSSLISAAALSIADIVSFHIIFTGTAPLADNGLGRTSEFYEKGEVVDSDTIRLFMAHWADQGSGTFVVQVYANTTNVSVIGNNAHADKSNQVVLGDNNITQLRSNTLKIKTNVAPTKGQMLEFNGTEYVASIITPQVLTYGATTTWNLDLGRNAKVTLTGNAALSIVNPVAGMFGIIKVVQDATGSRAITLPAGSLVSNGGGGAITLTTTANGIDILGFYYDGTNYFWKKEPNYT